MISKVDDADDDDDEAASENKAVDVTLDFAEAAFSETVNPWLTCTSDTSNITSFEIIVCCPL